MFIKGDFMTEKIKLRSEIDDKYKWDLTTIYQNEEKWQKDYEKAQSLFRNFPILTTIEGLNYVDTSMSNTFYSLFRDCSLLTNLDLSSFDTSHVTSMESMFADCASMTSIDLKNFNTNSLENIVLYYTTGTFSQNFLKYDNISFYINLCKFGIKNNKCKI